MSEASNVTVAFRDLTDALEALSSGSVSPVAVRRNFATFVDLSQKLTSYMRKEYSEKTGRTWDPSGFDGWNDATKLFKQLRNEGQHERPIFILVNETQYLRISADTPDELAVSGTWQLSLEDQHLDTPRDDIIFELGDPPNGPTVGTAGYSNAGRVRVPAIPLVKEGGSSPYEDGRPKRPDSQRKVL
jgi:hypothetical protein